ncbi:hypothetical protein J5Y03_02120 [Bacillus sp. RG28]|uniref:Uncharacterized protein n=1 Tax=Gottfriedia endophytica TaxID=2820819 RepID=A0A940SFG5_9BACI|nr:hypothetical protein [Gottfriedia endophytica]MBP0723977.1 hypothetical protein [Gottfriedia endophytica]
MTKITMKKMSHRHSHWCFKHTVQRTVKRMEELNLSFVSPRREIYTVNQKITQSSNLNLLLEYKPFKHEYEIIVGPSREVKSKIPFAD